LERLEIQKECLGIRFIDSYNEFPAEGF